LKANRESLPVETTHLNIRTFSVNPVVSFFQSVQMAKPVPGTVVIPGTSGIRLYGLRERTQTSQSKGAHLQSGTCVRPPPLGAKRSRMRSTW
jgi:hypothetical protein